MVQLEFAEFLRSHPKHPLNSDQIAKLTEFYGLVVQENAVQNLTRLISPSEFYEGHVEDVLALKQTGYLSESNIDLGTGLGSPGLIYAALFGGKWVLCDSEKSKAKFVEDAARKLNISNVIGVGERLEVYLATHKVECVVAKAVGPVERIHNWIRNSSTWNKLVLFKGPGWLKEWEDFQKTSQRKKLVIQNQYTYEVGVEKKSRIIIELVRS